MRATSYHRLELGRIIATEPELCGIALCAAALCGATVAIALPASRATLAVGGGLLIAAAGFAVGSAGPAGYLSGPRGVVLVAVCVPVAAGLSAALAAGLRTATAPGAMCGVVLLIAGVLTGYLADGAIELHTVAGADRDAATIHAALITADLYWNIAAAIVAGISGLIVFAHLRSRRFVSFSPA
jgi:hypothetical protein